VNTNIEVQIDENIEKDFTSKLADAWFKEVSSSLQQSGLNISSNSRLLKSFQKNSSENIFNVTNNNGITDFEIGTEVPYAAIHEYGFKGSENVKSFTRNSHDHSSLVKSFTRQMNMPAKPYFEPAMESLQSNIIPDLIEQLTNDIIEDFENNISEEIDG